MTTHYNVYPLTPDLKSTRGGGQHYAAANELDIAYAAKAMREVGDCYLVTELRKADPWAVQNHPQRYRLTSQGPVEIDEKGEPVSPHQVPLLVLAAATTGALEAFAFGRWYPAEVVTWTRTRIQVVVTTGGGPRPAKFYKPGGKSLRIAEVTAKAAATG